MKVALSPHLPKTITCDLFYIYNITHRKHMEPDLLSHRNDWKHAFTNKRNTHCSEFFFISGNFCCIVKKYPISKTTVKVMKYGEPKLRYVLLCRFMRFWISWWENKIDITERVFLIHMFNILWRCHEAIAMNWCNTYVTKAHNAGVYSKAHNGWYDLCLSNIIDSTSKVSTKRYLKTKLIPRLWCRVWY